MSDRPASVPASQSPDLRVRKFRHILLWPVQLMPLKEDADPEPLGTARRAGLSLAGTRR